MSTLAQIYERYKSNAHMGVGFGDKGTVHSYIEVYEKVLAPYRKTAKNVLEIGLLNGDSLRMWEEYFDTENVQGVDIEEKPMGLFDLTHMVRDGHKITFFDASLPEEVSRHFIGQVFDVVIEDASHALEHQLATYANMKPFMANDSIYIIEDVANIDTVRPLFESIDPDRHVVIEDRRHIKDRFDDVMVIITHKR
jgi:hypothetical protein